MQKKTGTTVGTFLTLLTLGIFRFYVVPQGFVRVVTRFGKFIRYDEAGLSFCLSFWGLYQQVHQPVSIMEQRLAPEEEYEVVYTSDGNEVRIDPVMYFKIEDPEKAIYEIEDYEESLNDLLKSMLRNECGNMSAQKLLGARQELASNLKDQLDDGTDPWGIDVRLVEIKQLDVVR